MTKPERVLSDVIKCEQVRLIMDNMMFGLVINLLIATILAGLIMGRVDDGYLLGWYLAAILVTLFRLLLSIRYQHNEDKTKNIDYWQQRLTASVFLMGVVWGLAGLLLSHDEDFYIRLLVVMALMSLTGGALVTMSALRKVYLAFVLPALLPFSFHEFTNNASFDPVMGWLMLLYATSMVFMSNRYYRFIHTSIMIRYEKDTIHSELEQAYAELETKNLELEHLSNHDALTGLHNRRWFDDYLEAEWRRAKRTGQHISVMLIDVDFFKRYNDHYGHQMGDECLKRVAALLQQESKRPADAIARYGGEEFAMVLPETDAQGAASLAELMRQSVHAQNIPHARAEELDRVTVSIGYASVIPRQEDRVDPLITQADEALYRAKAAGRNRISGSMD